MLYTVDILPVVPCPFVHVQSRQAVGRINPWYAWSFRSAKQVRTATLFDLYKKPPRK